MRTGPITKEWLMAQVSMVPDTGCWLWMNAVGHGGYGMLGRNNKVVYAHRVFYEAMRGAIPDGLHIDHLCRHRWCCNPDHMEAVTNKENILRGSGASARNKRKTHCNHGHAFDESNTIHYGGGRRRCRACELRKNKESWQRQKQKKELSL